MSRTPLAGWRVLVTRAAGASSELARRLAARGADVLEVPTIEIAPPPDGGAELAGWADRVGDLAWVVVTSANGAERLARAWGARALGEVRVAAVGSATAAALRRHGIEPDLVPSGPSSGASLGRALPPAPAGGGRVLLARAQVADPELARVLAGAGWEVEDVCAYRTVPVPVPVEVAVQAAGCDAVTFASASAVRSFVASAGTAAVPPVVACIGPSTAAAVADAGLTADVVADVQTLDGLVDALAAEARRRGAPPRTRS